MLNQPDKQLPDQSTEEESVSQLSVDEVVEIIFASFEISQGQGDIQKNLFVLIAEKYPSLRMVNIPIHQIAIAFVEKARNFLSTGKHHVSLDDSRMHSESTNYINVLKDALNHQLNPDVPTAGLERAILSEIISKDYDFLHGRGNRPHENEGNKYTSYVKKYFIDGHMTKNPHLRAVLLDIATEFFHLLREENIDFEDDLSVRKIEQATKNLVLRSKKQDMDDVLRLMVVAQCWEELNGGKQFWRKSERSRRN